MRFPERNGRIHPEQNPYYSDNFHLTPMSKHISYNRAYSYNF